MLLTSSPVVISPIDFLVLAHSSLRHKSKGGFTLLLAFQGVRWRTVPLVLQLLLHVKVAPLISLCTHKTRRDRACLLWQHMCGRDRRRGVDHPHCSLHLPVVCTPPTGLAHCTIPDTFSRFTYLMALWPERMSSQHTWLPHDGAWARAWPPWVKGVHWRAPIYAVVWLGSMVRIMLPSEQGIPGSSVGEQRLGRTQTESNSSAQGQSSWSMGLAHGLVRATRRPRRILFIWLESGLF